MCFMGGAQPPPTSPNFPQPPLTLNALIYLSKLSIESTGLIHMKYRVQVKSLVNGRVKFFSNPPGRCFNFFFISYTISPLLNFCEKMVFLNISERCLKINRTSTYVRGHHVPCETGFSPVDKTSL